MTSVGTEDMSSVAEGRVMLENQITFQEPKNHGEEIREEESWMRALIRGNIEEESWRRNKGREIIEEELCRRNQRRGVIEEEPWKRIHSGGSIKEGSGKSNRGGT